MPKIPSAPHREHRAAACLSYRERAGLFPTGACRYKKQPANPGSRTVWETGNQTSQSKNDTVAVPSSISA